MESCLSCRLVSNVIITGCLPCTSPPATFPQLENKEQSLVICSLLSSCAVD